MSEIQNILDKLEDNQVCMVSKFKRNLHGLIANNSIKEVQNLLTYTPTDFLIHNLVTTDLFGLNALQFAKAHGTDEMYVLIRNRIIEAKQGIVICHKRVA